MKVFGIYGESDSGKTSLIIRIIDYYSKKGFNISTIKISDKKVSIDQPGKDTYQHSQAGANLVVFSNPVETSYILKKRQNLDEIINNIRLINQTDLCIIEGLNDKKTPKIRLGEIDIRDQTIYTYKNNFKELLEVIDNKVIGG